MNELYTPREAAAEILGERQQDTALVDLVREYLGGSLPNDAPTDSPMAYLARYVPRATNEDRLFADQAREDGLTPYWSSYIGDKFTTRNPEKVATIRPAIDWAGGQRTRSWIVEPEKRVGGVGELETLYGYDATDFQQAVRRLVLSESGDQEVVSNTFDVGTWYKKQAERFGYTEGNLAPFYYPASMAFATVFGVLYEDFDGGPNAGNGDLKRFMDTVVYPAFQKVERDLGIAPLIVRLPYQEGMETTNLSFLDKEEASRFRNLGSEALLPDMIKL